MIRITLNLNGGYIAYANKDVPYDAEPGRGWYDIEPGVYGITLDPPADNTGTYSIELPVIRKDGSSITDYSFTYGNQQQSNGLRAKVTKSISDKSEETFWFEDGWVDCKIYPVWSENNIDYPFVVDLNGGTDLTHSKSQAYWSSLTLKYGESSPQLPALLKDGYIHKNNGWNITPVKHADISGFNTGSYNSSTRKFTQGYGLYTATPIFEVAPADAAIAGAFKRYSEDHTFQASNTTKYFRAALGYDLDITDTDVTITWNAYGQMHSGYQWYTHLAWQCGNETETSIRSMLNTNPGTSYANAVSKTGQTITIPREVATTEYPIKIKVWVMTSAGAQVGTTAIIEEYITIPALDPNRDLVIYGCNDSPIYRSLEIGETRTIQLIPVNQFYTVSHIKVYLTENDYATDNFIDRINIDGESINNENRGLFTYSYDSQTNILTYTQGSNSIILLVEWIEPIIGDTQSVYIYIKKGVIYARSFINSQQLFIDKQGSLHAPSFDIGDQLSFNKEGIIATNFIIGLPK